MNATAWTALICVGLVLALLGAAGLYLTLNISVNLLAAAVVVAALLLGLVGMYWHERAEGLWIDEHETELFL